MARKDISGKAAVIADGYFTKPYDEKYLISKVESLLSSACGEDEGAGLEAVHRGDNGNM